MGTQKKWQLILIIVVVTLTLYNIFPTLLFYLKPLNQPIHEKKGLSIAKKIVNRVNRLEEESIAWLKSYNKLLGLKPLSIELDPDHPQIIHLKYANKKEAERIKKYLHRAGALIPFVPAKLSLIAGEKALESTSVSVQRKISMHFDPSKVTEYFKFTLKRTQTGKEIAPLYRQVMHDRLMQLGLAIGGMSKNAHYLETILHHQNQEQADPFLQMLTQNILTYAKVFEESPSIASRYYATLTQGANQDKQGQIAAFIELLEAYRNQTKIQRLSLQDAEKTELEKGHFLDTDNREKLDYLKAREKQLTSAIEILKKNKNSFSQGHPPWTYSKLKQEIGLIDKNGSIETLLIWDKSPLIQAIHMDWNNEKFVLELHSDVLNYKKSILQSNPHLKEAFDQLVYNEIARISLETGERLTPYQETFISEFNALTNSQSLLVMDLRTIAKKQEENLFHLIENQWNPSHPDLKRTALPIYDYATYQKLPPSKQKIGLVIYTPGQFEEEPPPGFKSHSIYVIAKGIQEVLNKFKEDPKSGHAKSFIDDFMQLHTLLQNNGFNGYPGTTYPLSTQFFKDFIFEAESFYETLLNATREEFTARGTGKFAALEFTNIKQRILTLNRIETQEQEDLLRWRDEYQAAQVSPQLAAKYDIPPPIKNPLWNNLALSTRKYFRGDERKVLQWGLDLSGGKTVQIELRDSNHKPVTSNVEIKQGIDELYCRVNKMGVSEVSIRQEGSMITLDFPNAQGLSAADLIKASSMYFHVVNEKFSTNNPNLAPIVDEFLQNVWNEALVTNRKDIESLNQIAWKHLYGDPLTPEIAKPINEVAKALYDQGLRLPSPTDPSANSTFNDFLAKIAIFREDNSNVWQKQTHPLLIVMNNYALEGANLTDVHASYDPSRGNFLSFNIKGSQISRDGQKINPRNDLYHWTMHFSKEKIQGTPLIQFSRGEGWRMAVILNGSIINTATISSPLKEHVSISGAFTQREVSRLEADLKAGSLTFTPHILSEKNIASELGLKDRIKGITATFLSLILIVSMMVGYYRFAGLIASIAVLVNLLIIWATLVNVSAAVSLPGIAGVILTVGMAIDANVLVFERVREEFAVSGRIGSAMHAGYRKAFSAIIDSSVTTIIAALILLQFDSGPIKGFAITLIIGILSSMFTALFMTRYFFAGWVQNPKNKTLRMCNLIKNPHFHFLKYGKLSLYFSIATILFGGLVFLYKQTSILGMDFTGGYSITLELKGKNEENNQSQVAKALIKSGIAPQDLQVRLLSPSTHVKILLSKTLDQDRGPFANMPLQTDFKDVRFSYQNNPRIVWIVDALKKEGLEIASHSLQSLDKSWTSVSGQMSNAMRNNAIIGLLLSLLAILVYITLRFEFKYAISATLGLAIDVGITLALICIFNAIGMPVQIDLNAIAAIMTIIGYSLNDTIIIFDRIREDLKSLKKYSFSDVVTHALNVTLSRTVMTSGTTLIVLLVLLFLGGSAIFGLALVMVIGVLFGTFSSLFIAAPLLLYFDAREKRKMEKVMLHEN